jgi:RNA polymerase sigma-70 factor (ECF subfamily)
MNHPSAAGTSATLLSILRQETINQQAWGEFVRRYAPLIYRWCRQWRLQEADAQDVTQTILARLVVILRTFDYDATRSFRAYLKTLTGYALRDFLKERSQPGAGSGDSEVLSQLHSVEARDDLFRHLEAEFDRAVLEEAADRVRRRVEPHTWEAFRLTAFEGLSGAEAATRLGLKVATVFKAKSRVQHLLQQEVARLESV